MSVDADPTPTKARLPRVRTFGKAATVPYLRVPGSPKSRHLIVTFPKLHFGGTPPTKKVMRPLMPIDAHLLCLGSDEHTFIGPRRELNGLRTCAKLINREAARLDIPRANVIALGTSNGGVCALFIGLTAQVGWIMAGGPPVDMGSQLVRFAQIDGPSLAAKKSANEFLALADNGDGKEVEFFDRLIAARARKVTKPTRIDLYVSGTDRTRLAVDKLVAQMAGNPCLDVRQIEGEYGKHGQIPGPFAAYVREVLLPVCGASTRAATQP